MRQAKASELKQPAYAALTARVQEAELRQWFPVDFLDIDTFAEPEPSMGALVQLDSGDYISVIYGKRTETMQVLLPEGRDPRSGIDAFLEEVPLPDSAVTWRFDRDRERIV